MPRARKPGSGGTRVGAPGQAYPNRTDLNAQKNLPARVATGQTYGQAQQQLQAQRTVPMAPPPTPMPPPGPPNMGASPPPGPGGPPPPGQGQPPPPTPVPPGSLGPLAGPTARPAEPVTTGLPIGPGAGPEAMPPAPVGSDMPGSKVSDLFTQMAQQTGSAALAALAQRAQGMGT